MIGRHLLWEAARTWLVVAGVLLFLTMGLGFAKFISEAAAGNLPVDTVLLLAFYSAIENGDIVLPISILLAVLLTLGRLCRDNEMTALQAGGAALSVIYRPFIVLAVIVAMFSSVLSLYLAPIADLAIDQLTAETTANALQTLAPGRFQSFRGGQAVFYAGARDEQTGDLLDVFIRVRHHDNAGQPTQTVVTADHARQERDPDTGAAVLVLRDGWRYEGMPGQADYKVVQFEEQGIRLSPESENIGADDLDTFTTAALFAAGTPAAAAELQVRFSVPLSILILTLLALPLGRLPPRAGRYGRLAVGILLYVIYINMVHLAVVWVQTGTLPVAIGAWIVHLGMLVLAVVLILREQGVFLRRRRRRLS